MSDTPRTDVEQFDCHDMTPEGSGPDYVVPADFARQLERELAVAEARVAELEREVAWLRKGKGFPEKPGPLIFTDEVQEHLASQPPKGWKP